MEENTYPKIARNALVLALAVFVLTALFLKLSQHERFPQGVAVAARIICGLFLLPLLATAGYVVNMREQETKNLSVKEDAQLRAFVEPLLSDLTLDVGVGYYESEDANAFAFTPLFGGKSLIAFSSRLLKKANAEQLRAIAAHEVAHLKHGDARNKSYILTFHHWLKVWPMLFALMSEVLLKKALPPIAAVIALAAGVMLFTVGPAAVLAYLFTMLKGPLTLYVGSAIVFLWAAKALDRKLLKRYCDYSKEREFAADAAAAKMTSPEMIVSALDLLDAPGQAVSIFDTHPPLHDRKKRLGKS